LTISCYTRRAGLTLHTAQLHSYATLTRHTHTTQHHTHHTNFYHHTTLGIPLCTIYNTLVTPELPHTTCTCPVVSSARTCHNPQAHLHNIHTLDPLWYNTSNTHKLQHTTSTCSAVSSTKTRHNPQAHLTHLHKYTHRHLYTPQGAVLHSHNHQTHLTQLHNVYTQTACPCLSSTSYALHTPQHPYITTVTVLMYLPKAS
jgi:hypothetical protein